MELIKTKIEFLEDGFYLFSTVSCPMCENLKGKLKNVQANTIVTELDAYDHQQICQSLGLIGTPCLIEIRNGKEYDRMYGSSNKTKLELFLKGE